MGLRRRAREKTLQILYSIQFNTSIGIDEAKSEYYVHFELPSNYTAKIIEEERAFVEYLINQVFENRDEIDELIETAALNWKVERIAFIERNILKMAVAELLDKKNKIPFKATINEAIDIAKKFGSKESPGFVNGIVNKIADLLEVKGVKA